MQTRDQEQAEPQNRFLMTLEQYLAVPYVMEIESVELDDGVWVRRVAYPELPSCTIDDPRGDIERAIEEVERLRVREIARLVAAGDPAPISRTPLAAPVLFVSEPLADLVADMTKGLMNGEFTSDAP